jgi:hypothetical protein
MISVSSEFCNPALRGVVPRLNPFPSRLAMAIDHPFPFDDLTMIIARDEFYHGLPTAADILLFCAGNERSREQTRIRKHLIR